MRYLMTFSYDGTLFYGYQKQPGKRTIQSEIEKQLTKINSNKKVSISASGRTDRNVHAINQKAHFDLDKKDPEVIKRSLNKLLPDDIFVKKIELVKDDFHARFSVLKKKYRYKINVGQYNPLERNYVYQYNNELNVDLMKKASKYLIGEHNFKAFTKVDEEKEDYIRKIYEINFFVNDNIVEIEFIGSGFLRYMIRNIVGTLIDIANGKIALDELKNIILSCDRKKAGFQAPACGLYLEDVLY